jgi:hypothetical protein
VFSIFEGKYPGQVKKASAFYSYGLCFQSYTCTGLPDLKVRSFPLVCRGQDSDIFLKIFLKCFCPCSFQSSFPIIPNVATIRRKAGSRATVFCTATVLRAERSEARIPVRARDLSLLQNVQTELENPPQPPTQLDTGFVSRG